jgi:hypothetical protein
VVDLVLSLEFDDLGHELLDFQLQLVGLTAEQLVLLVVLRVFSWLVGVGWGGLVVCQSADGRLSAAFWVVLCGLTVIHFELRVLSFQFDVLGGQFGYCVFEFPQFVLALG